MHDLLVQVTQRSAVGASKMQSRVPIPTPPLKKEIAALVPYLPMIVVHSPGQ